MAVCGDIEKRVSYRFSARAPRSGRTTRNALDRGSEVAKQQAVLDAQKQELEAKAAEVRAARWRDSMDPGWHFPRLG